jgi:hypothetical protein
MITRSQGRVVAIGLARTALPLTPDDIILDCKEYVSFEDLIKVELSEHWLDIQECVN